MTAITAVIVILPLAGINGTLTDVVHFVCLINYLIGALVLSILRILL